MKLRGAAWVLAIKSIVTMLNRELVGENTLDQLIDCLIRAYLNNLLRSFCLFWVPLFLKMSTYVKVQRMYGKHSPLLSSRT